MAETATAHSHDLTAKQELFQTVTEAGKCPLCGEELLQNDGSGHVLKSRVTKFQDNLMLAKCKHCKIFINVPLNMLKGFTIPVMFKGKRYKFRLG